jgi:hypothetical protein
MAARLKSILGRIHWSLLLRAAIFGFAWLVLPFWLFLILALYLYFVPFFEIKKLAVPFLAVIFFAAIEPKGTLLAVIFAAIFYLTLGIKDLIFIERKPAYETLVLLLAFFAIINFFSHFDSWDGGWPFLCVLAAGVLIFLLTRGFLNYGTENGPIDAERFRRGSVFGAIVGLVSSQIIIAALFLPLNYLYQSALAFLVVALAVEFSSDCLGGRLTRRVVLANLSIFLAFAVIILESANWTL